MLRQQSQVIDSEASGYGGDGIDLALTPDGVAVAGSTALRNGGAGITLLCPGSAVSKHGKVQWRGQFGGDAGRDRPARAGVCQFR